MWSNYHFLRAGRGGGGGGGDLSFAIIDYKESFKVHVSCISFIYFFVTFRWVTEQMETVNHFLIER